MNTIHKNLKFDATFQKALDQLCLAQHVAGFRLAGSFYVPAANEVVLIFQK
jgi:hypothetical protein